MAFKRLGWPVARLSWQPRIRTHSDLRPRLSPVGLSDPIISITFSGHQSPSAKVAEHAPFLPWVCSPPRRTFAQPCLLHELGVAG
ncbi:hypothetical protein SLEP1_g13340 [Rubroshorea leprosula]|uniref:Uncharacterized protein n=1 Tax=Rubroshorea leprosula TaxID=152421 RepID=A0AAV5ILE2_9ROSI|nr:hypothetical protein SLEP1_g13340 [Rubroshorea leprosula]